MRRVRKNLINKPADTKREVSIEEALAAREANLLGQNGLLHGQDRYLAQAKLGDLVIPLDQLSPETREKLEAKIDDLKSRTAGHGGELSVSHLLSDGFGLAEHSDEADLIALARRAHEVSAHRKMLFDEAQTRKTIQAFLSGHPTHQLFIYKKGGRTRGVLAARAQQLLLCKGCYVEVEGFFVNPVNRSYAQARDFMQVLEVWARTLEATEIWFAALPTDRVQAFSSFLKRSGYSVVGDRWLKELKTR